MLIEMIVSTVAPAIAATSLVVATRAYIATRRKRLANRVANITVKTEFGEVRITVKGAHSQKDVEHILRSLADLEPNLQRENPTPAGSDKD